jgi:hypothetical protein
MLRIRPTWVVLTCALFLNAAPVSIFNDVTNPPEFENSLVEDGPFGASFSTGATAYTLTSAVLVLSADPIDAGIRSAGRPIHGFQGRHASARAAKAQTAKPSKAHPAADPTGSVTVALYSDTGGPGIGTLLATSATTLPDTSLGESPAQFSFPFSYALSANTRYWIVLSTASDSVAGWWGTSDISGTDVAPEYTYGIGEVFANDPGGALLMQVIGDPATPPPTPAPASVTLVLIGLGCALWYFRRRKILRST